MVLVVGGGLGLLLGVLGVRLGTTHPSRSCAATGGGPRGRRRLLLLLLKGRWPVGIPLVCG